MSEEMGSKVLDYLKLVKRRRANAAKKSAAIVHAARDKGMTRNFSSRLREAWSVFGDIVHGGKKSEDSTQGRVCSEALNGSEKHGCLLETWPQWQK
ncbi:hypothetical protein SRHO_G00107640 [Serrasalmus rhombeus]